MAGMPYTPTLNPKISMHKGIQSGKVLTDITPRADSTDFKNKTMAMIKEKASNAIKECGGNC
jgi:hypothetical protein